MIRRTTIELRPTMPGSNRLTDCIRRSAISLAMVVAVALGNPVAASAASRLGQFLDKVQPSDMVPGADAFGGPAGDPPIVPVLRGGQPVGSVFLNSDFAESAGYSGKPIHILVALDDAARVTGLRLVDHKEPIVLIGIPEARIRKVIDGYVGLDIAAVARRDGPEHDLDIVSGATVTIMVIDDLVVRAAIKVARRLSLGGLKAQPRVTAGPVFAVDPSILQKADWKTLLGDGSVRRLHLSVADVNKAFEDAGEAEAAALPEPEPVDDDFIDLYAAVVSIPTIGRSLLGEAEYRNLTKVLAPGQTAILLAARGRYSFKGSGYVRGGLFDRFQVIQGDGSTRFRDKHHKRLGGIAAAGAPKFTEVDLFVVPAEKAFDAALGWRLELLVGRAIGPTRKAFLTFDLGYAPPEKYLRRIDRPAATASAESAAAELVAAVPLWQRLWRQKSVEVAVLVLALGLLTIVFFFQDWLTKRPRLTGGIRFGFLVFTVVGIGFYANAQLSVVNVMTFFNAFVTGFRWEYFLLEPLIFVLWCSVAASLLFWGRGAYCGWLCPFGALQELLNRGARLLHVPQIRVPWWLHQRLWPLKYMIFLALFGISLYSLAFAEQLAEIEPFKTSIVLKFVRDWPFVLYAVGLLVVGLFIERFFCRYLCPLGAALAIPGRMRMFDWLVRYRECGHPCQRCANECMVGAIHPEGHINPNECLSCLHCQTLYHDDRRCPVVIQRRLKRERRQALASKPPPTVGTAPCAPSAAAAIPSD